MRVPHKPPPGWMTRPQAVKFLGVSATEFLRIAERHKLFSKKDKSTHIYLIEDLEKIMVARNAGFK